MESDETAELVVKRGGFLNAEEQTRTQEYSETNWIKL